MMYYLGNMMGWGLGGFIMLLFWIAPILIIVWLVKEAGVKKGEDRFRSPFDILKERYAKGEISKEEFEQMKKDLL